MFEGFSRNAPAFFHELAAEMSKDWFDANKQRYHDEWVAPMTALLAQVSAGLAKIYAPKQLEANVLRIYRDTRFARDKTPYKTHIAGRIALTARKPIHGGVSAMYVHLGIDEEFVGAGTYFFDDKQLAKWRKLVAADKTGKPIEALIAKTRKRGYWVGGHDDYVRVPRPFAADHPREALLRMKGLTVGFPEMPKGMLHQAKLASWLVAHGKAAAALVTMISDQLR
ncbi:MAG TPA: DUF2461 domain-containing protein [Kofleriaceae bacterium]|nr:DUF2461 domain-containing protein [Kofleriaceae bacterium]